MPLGLGRGGGSAARRAVDKFCRERTLEPGLTPGARTAPEAG